MQAHRADRNTRLGYPEDVENLPDHRLQQPRIPFETATADASKPSQSRSVHVTIPNNPQYEVIFHSTDEKFFIGQASDGHLVALHEFNHAEVGMYRLSSDQNSRPFEFGWKQGDTFFAARPYLCQEYPLRSLPFSSSVMFRWNVLGSLLHKVRGHTKSRDSITHALYQMLLAVQTRVLQPDKFTFDLEAFVISSQAELAPYLDVEKGIVDWETVSHPRHVEAKVSVTQWNHVLHELQHVARDDFAKRQLSLLKMKSTINMSQERTLVSVSQLLRVSAFRCLESNSLTEI